MNLDFSSEIPIYIQIAQSIEDGILNGIFNEDEVIPSTTEISVNFKINPATVAKGFNLLVDEGIIYKIQMNIFNKKVKWILCQGHKKKTWLRRHQKLISKLNRSQLF